MARARELVVGVVLAAALIAAVVLLRDSGVADSDGPAVAIDLSEVDGEFGVDGITVSATAEPRPLRVFDPLRFAFRFRRGGEEIIVTEPRIEFNMVMDMGPHDYRLVRDEARGWLAENVVLPQCGSGSRLWFGELTFQAEGQPHVARVKFELDPPRAD